MNEYDVTIRRTRITSSTVRQSAPTEHAAKAMALKRMKAYHREDDALSMEPPHDAEHHEVTSVTQILLS